jgi:hypothetical protein
MDQPHRTTRPITPKPNPTKRQTAIDTLRVHGAVREQAQFFELVGGEEVGFVDDEHDVFAAFVGFGGE